MHFARLNKIILTQNNILLCDAGATANCHFFKSLVCFVHLNQQLPTGFIQSRQMLSIFLLQIWSSDSSSLTLVLSQSTVEFDIVISLPFGLSLAIWLLSTNPTSKQRVLTDDLVHSNRKIPLWKIPSRTLLDIIDGVNNKQRAYHC